MDTFKVEAIVLFLMIFLTPAVAMNYCPTCCTNQYCLGVDMTGGTEYGAWEKVSLMAFVTNNSTPLIGALNNLIVYYPNTTPFINDTMLEFGNGTYYYNFTAPPIEGVYFVYDNVSILNNWTMGYYSFHIAPWVGKLSNIETTGLQYYSDIVKIKESVKNIPMISDGVNFLSAWFSTFNINFNYAFILGLSVVAMLMFAIMSASLYTVDKLKHKEEKVYGYL